MIHTKHLANYPVEIKVCVITIHINCHLQTEIEAQMVMITQGEIMEGRDKLGDWD